MPRDLDAPLSKQILALARGATARPWAAEEEDVGDDEFVYCTTAISSPSGLVVDQNGGMMPERTMPLDECDANAALIVLLANHAERLAAALELAEAVDASLTAPVAVPQAIREALSRYRAVSK